jgi:hypothetical protein
VGIAKERTPALPLSCALQRHPERVVRYVAQDGVGFHAVPATLRHPRHGTATGIRQIRVTVARVRAVSRLATPSPDCARSPGLSTTRYPQWRGRRSYATSLFTS